MKEFKFKSRNDDDNKEIFKLDDSKPLKKILNRDIYKKILARYESLRSKNLDEIEKILIKYAPNESISEDVIYYKIIGDFNTKVAFGI